MYVVSGTTQFVLSLENCCPGITLPDIDQLSAEDRKFGASTHFFQHGP